MTCLHINDIIQNETICHSKINNQNVTFLFIITYFWLLSDTALPEKRKASSPVPEDCWSEDNADSASPPCRRAKSSSRHVLHGVRMRLNSDGHRCSLSSFHYRQRRKQEQQALKTLVHQLEVSTPPCSSTLIDRHSGPGRADGG